MSQLAPVVLTSQNAEAADAFADLSAMLELWSPALLQHWLRVPSLEAIGEHVQPKAAHLYVIKADKIALLPVDWRQLAEQAGSLVFISDGNAASLRKEIHLALGEAVATEPDWQFLGLGYGCWLLDQLAEAMAHANPLDEQGLLETMRSAAMAADEGRRAALAKAADSLRAARDVLYPSTLHLLTLVLLHNDPWQRLPDVIAWGVPTNVVCSGESLRRLAESFPLQTRALQQAVEAGFVELCGGGFAERPVSLFPIEGCLADQRQGHQAAQEALAAAIAVQASPCFGAHPLWTEVAHAIRPQAGAAA